MNETPFEKQYNTKNIQYQYSLVARKWEFKMPSVNHTLLQPCKGGIKVARKVAGALEGSLTRTGKKNLTGNLAIDALARGQIKALTGV